MPHSSPSTLTRRLPATSLSDTTNSGWELYTEARELIPGGTQLLSKRPEMFLPEGWPCYYSHAKGCEIWDLDGRRFIDMTSSGIGACLLGYADDDVNAAVKACIDAGSMTTLNVPAEVELAKILCQVHPWASMCRFARTGGEAMMIAVRIARAFTGRSKIAVCGYHGWGDWYLSANLSEGHALDGHLLPGLAPAGVPRELAGTVSTFRFNHPEELEAIIRKVEGELAAIVIEPMRFAEPVDGFLQRVRALADSSGAALILDEISAGWRHNFGGMHLQLGVAPDIAVFAKSLSNGFPMSAVIGTAKVMQAAQDSFISSSYWTEAIGPTAAVATLAKMQAVGVSEHASRIGAIAQAGWKRLAHQHNLNLSVSGRPSLCMFSLNHGDISQTLRTLLTQEMLDRGYLANTAFYPALTHTPGIVEQYLAALDEAFAVLRDSIDRNDAPRRLRGPVAHSGFARLT
jgi:glutamate-1-semialdehyde aminotransferase